jgi:hypothetical protein
VGAQACRHGHVGRSATARSARSSWT